MSFTSSLIILSLLTLVIYGQNFDDYFEFDEGETSQLTTNQPLKPENSSTQKTPISTTTPSTNQEPTTLTTTTSTTPSKRRTTTSTPSEEPKTTTTTPSEEPKTTTNTNFSIRIQPSIYLLLEELVNKSFEKLEKKFDRLISLMIASKPEATPEEKKPTEKMEEKTTPTEENKLNRLAEENVFDDPFFHDNTDEILAEKKKMKREKENFEQLLMISIGSAACGTSILLMVVLFLHLHNKKQNVKKEVENPVEPVYNEVGPPRAEPEDDIPYADDDEIELNSI